MFLRSTSAGTLINGFKRCLLLSTPKVQPKVQLTTQTPVSPLLANCSPWLQQTRSINYNSNDLWKSVLLVSTQGSKKGRGKRRGAGKAKDLNAGQFFGDGKLQVKWPGLNAELFSRDRGTGPSEANKIKVIGIDEDREKKLTEIRNKMDKFRRVTVFPHERGFTSSSLPGKFIGPPVSYNEVDFKDFETCIVDYKVMIMHKSKLGKKKTIGTFVITGNRKGILGYGLGKSSISQSALAQAKAIASKNLLYFNFYENRTLLHNFYEQYYYTKIYAEKVPEGHGLRCHRVIKRICQLVGIKDLYAKVEGSRNPMNITKAFICGLLNQQKYAEIAKDKKLHLVEFKPELRYFPRVLASPAQTQASPSATVETKSQAQAKPAPAADDALPFESDEDYLKRVKHHEKENDLSLFLFNNREILEKKIQKPFYANYPSYLRYCYLRDKDRALQQARIERLKSLTDQALDVTKYPYLPRKIRDKVKSEVRARNKAIIAAARAKQ